MNRSRDAVVMLIPHGQQLVFIRRGPGIARAHYWAPPSGRLEPNESAPDALRREAMEELRLAIDPLRPVYACDTDDGRFRLHWWLCRAHTQDLIPDGREVAEARWLSVDQWLRLSPTFAAHRQFFTLVWPGIGTRIS